MLKQEHYEVMKAVKDGATIYGYVDAKRLREVQKFDSELIEIIGLKDLEEITGEEYNGAEQLPYFGAILTGKGKEVLNNSNSEFGQ
ncbi:hypothetical protein [Metabacillus arenae]|uniref:Uncharacterized protein n=1 Tax=Metabacillus arenae TaxID=2771434 RepID=A0A926NCS6_9BACI|nr:hypothetical protein [Metabacillus arenae]MBD1379164.1 hypothetical protein [Metabacillus arenae]